jgi:DNA-binding CsgD family transcriptional regulator
MIDLGGLIGSIGRHSFDSRIFQTFQQLTHAEEVVVHRYRKDRGVDVIAAYSAAGVRSLDHVLRVYVGAYFRRDPLAERLLPSEVGTIEVQVVHAPEVVDADYRRKFFTRRGIASKVSIVSRCPDHVTTVSVYNREEPPNVLEHRVAFMKECSSTVDAIVKRHADLIRPDRFETLESVVSALTILNGHCLSEREANVCARILLGCTTEGIALSLGISNSTVTEYRRRAYRKLQIATQNELFACLLMHRSDK